MDFVQNYPIPASFLVSLGINMLFFTFAAILKTDKVTDLSYSLSFYFLSPILLIAGGRPYGLHRILLTAAIMLWALRLGSYLFYRILKIGKDDRFDDKRQNFVAFLKFWILQTIAVWAIMLPFAVVLTEASQKGLNPALILGLLIFTVGLLIESISDIQKFRFKIKPENSNKWVDSGLWSKSRHPNYFGEILVWWGLFIAASPGLNGWYWLTVIGPLFITILLLFVSGIPLLEESAERKYGDSPEYRRYKESTSLILPLPKRSKEKE